MVWGGGFRYCFLGYNNVVTFKVNRENQHKETKYYRTKYIRFQGMFNWFSKGVGEPPVEEKEDSLAENVTQFSRYRLPHYGSL